jgi:hypothetical protein
MMHEFGCQAPFDHQLINDTHPSLEAKKSKLVTDGLVEKRIAALKIQRVTTVSLGQSVVKMWKDLKRRSIRWRRRRRSSTNAWSTSSGAASAEGGFQGSV